MSQHNPVVRDVIYVAPQRDWSFPLHTHEEFAELSFVIAGRGTVYHDSRNWIVTRGMLVVKNAGISHAEWSDTNDPIEQICVSVGGVNFEGLSENQVIPEGFTPVVALEDELELVEQCFLYLRKHGKEAGYEAVCGKIIDVVLDLARSRCSMGDWSRDAHKKTSEQLVSDAVSYIDQHYREKIRIRDLANRLFTSDGNLSRQFKRITGFTINEYVISKRMGEAQRLLMFEDDDIKDIARACGYDSIQYFYRVFSEYAHCTPAEFRRRYRS